MVYGTGTSVRDWHSRSGYRGQTTSQTLVAGMATPPVKRSVLWPLLWLLALLVICGGLRAVVQEEQRMGAQVTTVRRSALVPRRGGMVRAPVAAPASAKTDFPWGQVEQVVTLMLWVGALAGMAVLLRAVWFNRRVYPERLAGWSATFLCRGCGTMFQP